MIICRCTHCKSRMFRSCQYRFLWRLHPTFFLIEETSYFICYDKVRGLTTPSLCLHLFSQYILSICYRSNQTCNDPTVHSPVSVCSWSDPFDPVHDPLGLHFWSRSHHTNSYLHGCHVNVNQFCHQFKAKFNLFLLCSVGISA